MSDATTPPAPLTAAGLARKVWRTLEPVHAFIYFAPLATAAYRELGVGGQAGYFASRAAAMGPVPAEVVVATFYNFNPRIVHAAIPAAWQAATPEQFVVARRAAADSSLRDLLGDGVDSPEMAEAASLARRAAEGCTPEGRALYAGHASLDWPTEPHMVLWHAVTLLREHRGDGHIAALVAAGIDGCESLVTHGAARDNMLPIGILQSTRGWDDRAWQAAKDRLTARGLLEGEELTPAGADLRAQVESQTDRAASAPWSTMANADALRLRELVRPYSRTIMSSGLFV